EVDVIEGLGKADQKPQLTGTQQKSFKGILCSHSGTCKQARIRRCRPNKIVAPVVRGAYDEIGRSKNIECGKKNGAWKVWAVAVERNHAALPRREMREHRRKPCSQTLACLRHYRNVVPNLAR